MAVSIASNTSGRSSGVSRLSNRVLVVLLLALKFLKAEQVFPTNGSQTEDESHAGKPGSVLDLDLDLYPVSQTESELELTLARDSNLTLTMFRGSSMQVNVTLRCSHPSVTYFLRMSSENKDIAALIDFDVFNISCACAVFRSNETGGDSPEGATSSEAHSLLEKFNSSVSVLSSVPVVEGTFTFTLQGGVIGRTWLHIFAERHSDPGVVLPSSLTLSWNDTSEAPVSKISKQERGKETNDTAGHPVPGNDKNSDTGGGVSETLYEMALNHLDGTESSRGPVATYSISPPHLDAGAEKVEAELQKHLVTVLRVPRPIDIAFRAVLYGFVIFATIGMGCKTDVSVVKDVLKKPVAPAIGFVCQYVFMPLIAFLLAKTVVRGNPAVSLGIFTCGICPGGGASNMYTYLLDGDVSLSVTMTAASTVAALAMIPLWLFTLGTLFEDDKISPKVPFLQIFMTLIFIIIPLFIGLAIKKWVPKATKWILRVLKPFTLVAIIFLLTMGVYANLYIFRLFNPSTILAGCLLPYIGYSVGAAVSLAFRQPCFRVKTIAIETGIQNTSIAYLLLVFSLPAPDGDLAAVGPVASAVMTPLPLFLLVVVYLTYKRCKRRRKQEKEGKDGAGEEVGWKKREKGEGGGGGEEEEEEEVALKRVGEEEEGAERNSDVERELKSCEEV